jgi:heavy metal translocating P-type ATPase
MPADFDSESDEQPGWLSGAIAAGCVVAMGTHFLLRWQWPDQSAWHPWPLWLLLATGGLVVVWDLGKKLLRGQFSSDLLAAVSIVASLLMGEYLAGTIIVLMASGGEAIEAFAVRSASSVLRELARRMPVIAHRRREETMEDVAVDVLEPGDVLAIYPHEICPVDGIVVEGHGTMDESFLTGEPYNMSKTPGTEVISGALNGESGLVIRATRRPTDSRYAQIMKVMEGSQQQRPRMRRLGDQLGAWYTPLALAVATIAAVIAWNPTRFLAVIIAATPCPLLIAIPVAIVGAVSLAARRGIIIKDPAVLELVDSCTTWIFDKTGTLTYGQPRLVEQVIASELNARQVLSLVASVERYSKHPLASAILRQAEEEGVPQTPAEEVHEPPGQGLRARVQGRNITVTSRKLLQTAGSPLVDTLPPQSAGMECVVVIDGQFAAVYRFRDAPRTDGGSFIRHLQPRHRVAKVLLVSGDRESEVRYLADAVGITDVRAEQSPEQKLEIVRAENKQGRTLFVGDGINDAPALAAATVGVAFGAANDITGAAAGAVVLDTSLAKVDEFLHISRRMRQIALQSAVGGIVVSLVGMLIAAFGYLPPVGGAILQEVVDVVAVLNAVRVAIPPRELTDY